MSYTVRCPPTPGADGVGRRYTGCGVRVWGRRDREGLVTCRHCGLIFDPDNSSRRGQEPVRGGMDDTEVVFAAAACVLVGVGALAGAAVAGIVSWGMNR